MARKALGKGLEALIPRTGTGGETEAESASLPRQSVPVETIRPNPWQPRRSSDPSKMEELVRSIRAHGVLEPLIVRRVGESIELVAGERRLKAAQQAKIQEVPVIFVDIDDKQSLEFALIENLQREDLNPIDEAHAYQILVQDFSRTHDEIAQQVGKDRSTITNLLRLLRLPTEVQDRIAEKALSMGHARALLGLTDADSQRKLAEGILREGWSVREVERRIAERNAKSGSPKPKERRRPPRDPHIARVEEAIRRRVGTDVRLQMNRSGGGRLEFLCADREDLERVLELLDVQVR
ncbi:MAG: ParB/RepB/Spo0J family partition protein [Candidatus Latescibacteria bacterium]|nr:ParB/RepB/Spo0J family partition protein [Candidatus Latescibacterota bacterium]